MSASGMQQTLSGVLMDASCPAIADARSELTRTPRILPPASERTPAASRARSERSTDDRSATEQGGTSRVSETMVPERYRSCGLTSSTSSFALLVNDRVYMLDRVSNQMMQERRLKTRSDRPDAKWVNTTVVGTATSDNVLTLRSIRP